MESKIIMEDIIVEDIENGIIEATVVDEKGNPASGKIIAKLNDLSFYSGRVQQGKLRIRCNFSHLTSEEYDLKLVFGGNTACDPSYVEVKLIIKQPEPVYVSFNDMQNACYRLTKWIEINKRLPGKISINDNNVSMANLLYDTIVTLDNVKRNKPRTVLLTRLDSPKLSSENITNSYIITEEEYLNIANNIKEYINATNKAPEYIDFQNSKVGFMNLVYSYAKILANSSSTGLISSFNLRPWKDIVAK